MSNNCYLYHFETLLSTERNLLLLKHAKEKGYFIKCIYVLTADPMINVMRVKSRFAAGGHDAPQDKILSRYTRALTLIPELVQIRKLTEIENPVLYELN